MLFMLIMSVIRVIRVIHVIHVIRGIHVIHAIHVVPFNILEPFGSHFCPRLDPRVSEERWRALLSYQGHI